MTLNSQESSVGQHHLCLRDKEAEAQSYEIIFWCLVSPKWYVAQLRFKPI